jgi:hypothetical protein
MIEIQPTGSAQGTAGGYVIGDVDAYPLTYVDIPAGSFAANTSYDFFVVNVCSGGNSTYAGPFTFTTECDAVSDFPYTEDFDTNWSCWSVINADADSYTWSQSATYITPRSGTSTAHGMGSNNDYLVSPKLTLTGNERVVWYDVVESSNYNNTYDVLLSTSGKEISDFTVNLGTYDCTNTSWTEHILDLSAYSGDVYIALHQTYSAATFYGFGVDDFSVETIPSALSMQGIIDFSLPGGWAKAVHLVATEDIADLSVYGIAAAMNGAASSGTPDLNLTGSALAGDHILVAKSSGATETLINTYMNASNVFDDVQIFNTALQNFNGRCNRVIFQRFSC